MGKPVGLAKSGGRTKGTPNKKTQELKAAFDELEFSVPTRLLELIPKLSLDKQVNAYLQLMPYLYPRFKPQEHPSLNKNQGSSSKVILTLPSNGREAKGVSITSEDQVQNVRDQFLDQN